MRKWVRSIVRRGCSEGGEEGRFECEASGGLKDVAMGMAMTNQLFRMLYCFWLCFGADE